MATTTKNKMLSGCAGEDIVDGNYYKPIDRLPIKYTIDEKHYIAGEWTKRERVYTLNYCKDKDAGSTTFWYECNNKMSYLLQCMTTDEANGRKKVIEHLNTTFKMMHEYNAKHFEFGSYKVSVEY